MSAKYEIMHYTNVVLWLIMKLEYYLVLFFSKIFKELFKLDFLHFYVGGCLINSQREISKLFGDAPCTIIILRFSRCSTQEIDCLLLIHFIHSNAKIRITASYYFRRPGLSCG